VRRGSGQRGTGGTGNTTGAAEQTGHGLRSPLGSVGSPASGHRGPVGPAGRVCLLGSPGVRKAAAGTPVPPPPRIDNRRKRTFCRADRHTPLWRFLGPASGREAPAPATGARWSSSTSRPRPVAGSVSTETGRRGAGRRARRYCPGTHPGVSETPHAGAVLEDDGVVRAVGAGDLADDAADAVVIPGRALFASPLPSPLPSRAPR
jgi:hypothetical protein